MDKESLIETLEYDFRGKLACQNCGEIPFWYKLGEYNSYQDYDSADEDIEVFCPICGGDNLFAQHFYEPVSYYTWNNKIVKPGKEDRNDQ